MLGHGFGGSARNWGPQARALADRRRVLRFDARGHARSEAPTDPAAYTPTHFVDDVARVLDQAGVERAVVGGLSMGAGVALRFASTYPERTRALVLAAFPPGADAPDGFAAVAERFATAIEQRGLEAAGAEFAWGPGSGLDPRGAALVRQGFLEHPPHGLALTLRGLIAVQPPVDALASTLARIARPTLVIVGERDRMSRDASHRLAALLPDARLVELPDAGHVCNLSQPGPFNAALVEFLDALA